LGLGSLGEYSAYPVEEPGIGGHDRSGSTTNGALGNMHQPFDMTKPGNRIHLDAVSIFDIVSIVDGGSHIVLDYAGHHVGDKRGFAGARNTCDGGELAKRK